MAYFVDYAATYLNAAVTGGAMNMPPHQTNDILVMFVTMDTGTATITSGTGWSTPASNTTQAGITATWSWKRAASAAEAVSITTSDAYCCGIYCIRDVDTTTAVDVSALSSAAAPTLPAKPISDAVTTTTTDCFVLYLLGSDGIATAAHSDPGVQHINSFDNAGTTATTASTQHAAWYYQRAIGATPTPSWTQSAANAYVKLTVAFRNVAGGRIPAYIDDVSSPATVITPAHNYTNTVNNVTWTTTLTSTAAINGKTVTGLTGAAQADLGIVPFSSGVATAATLVARTALQGYQCSLTGNRNWSTGLIMGSFIGATPKMGTFGIGGISDGGCVVRIGSSATAWCAWQVAAKDAVPTAEVRSVWAIQPSYTTSSYGTPGTAITTTAVSHIQFLFNSPLFASQAVLSEVYQVFTQIISGGSASAPVDVSGLADIGRSFRLPVIQKFGGSGIFSYAPLQIGGGDAVNFQLNTTALQFPRRYNTTTKEVAFHAADNTVGISYAGKSGDVIKHTNSVITSPTRYYWEINSAATSAATWDFDGLTVVNASVTLRPVTTFTGITFNSSTVSATNASSLNNCVFNACAEFTASSATFTSCTFTASTGTNGAVSITGATQSALQAELNKFVTSSFTNNTTPLGALRIIFTGAGGSQITLDMTNLSFSGNTADVRWEAPASTNLLVNKLGTTNASTFSATNSNTVSFQVSATLQITGLVAGSDIVILNAGTTTERVNVDANASTTYNYGYTTTGDVDICIYKQGYIPYTVRAYTLSAGGGSLPVKQVLDRNFNNPV